MRTRCLTRSLLLKVVALCAVGMQLSAAGQGPPRQRPPSSGSSTQSGTRTVSPTVVATHVAGFTPDGSRVLELLVLWRGAPAWFTRASGNGTSAGGDGRRYNSTLRYGEIELQLEFDRQLRVATIQGNRVDLGDDNVVFVDGVDAGAGLRVVRTLRVDPGMNRDQFPRIDEVMRRSPEILSFLQCDTRLSDPLQQKFADIVCANVLGNQAERSERFERRERSERLERFERFERLERLERLERSERSI